MVGTKYPMLDEHVPVFLCGDPKLSVTQGSPRAKLHR